MCEDDPRWTLTVGSCFASYYVRYFKTANKMFCKNSFQETCGYENKNKKFKITKSISKT